MLAPRALARLAYKGLAGWSMEESTACGALTTTCSPCARFEVLLVTVACSGARFVCLCVDGNKAVRMNIDVLKRKVKRGENRRTLGNGRGRVLGHKERLEGCLERQWNCCCVLLLMSIVHPRPRERLVMLMRRFVSPCLAYWELIGKSL